MSSATQLANARKLKVVYVYRRTFWKCSRCAWRLRAHDSVPNAPALKAFAAHACELYVPGKEHKPGMAAAPASTLRRAS